MSVKYSEIQAMGASLVAISPQLEHYNQELVKERKLPFEVRSDHIKFCRAIDIHILVGEISVFAR